ncbi:hypothetical protein [Tortoise microvirus 74]|nr:hypothetical protein [Tortoise microvirus 74]
MSWFGGSLNVSSGGHVYDRTTGTWAGETQGSVGDGVDRSVSASVSTVWHDANGPTGVQYHNPGDSGGTGSVSQGHVASGPVADPVVAGGTGAGAGVANTSGPASGGSGPGSPAVVSGDKPGKGGALEPKRKATHTQLQIGLPGGWTHNPNWSDTAEWEERYGEPGDWLGGIVTMGVDVGHNAKRAWEWWQDNGRDSEWMKPKVDFSFAVGSPFDPLAGGSMPKQEPVDWGR